MGRQTEMLDLFCIHGETTEEMEVQIINFMLQLQHCPFFSCFSFYLYTKHPLLILSLGIK